MDYQRNCYYTNILTDYAFFFHGKLCVFFMGFTRSWPCKQAAFRHKTSDEIVSTFCRHADDFRISNQHLCHFSIPLLCLRIGKGQSLSPRKSFLKLALLDFLCRNISNIILVFLYMKHLQFPPRARLFEDLLAGANIASVIAMFPTFKLAADQQSLSRN